jgi:hypothetical protein
MASKIRILRSEFSDRARAYEVNVWTDGRQYSIFAASERDAWAFAEKLRQAIADHMISEVPEISSNY